MNGRPFGDHNYESPPGADLIPKLFRYIDGAQAIIIYANGDE
jgi:hypothetical protein